MTTHRFVPDVRVRLAGAVVATGVMALLAAGCGSDATHAAAGSAPPPGRPSNGASAPSSSTIGEPTATPSTLTPQPPPTAVRPKPGGGAPTVPTGSTSDDMTVTGTVTDGAEPSCLLVTYQKVEYLLLTDNPAIVAGESVRATGHVAQGIRTHCQQGIPFEVTQVKVTSLR